MPVSLRTKKTEDIYQNYLKTMDKSRCPFCKKSKIIKEYKYWIVVPNRFPYDAVAGKHNLLISKRHTGKEEELLVKEKRELDEIKKEIMHGNDYDYIQENVVGRRTVEPHYHIHLIKFA